MAQMHVFKEIGPFQAFLKTQRLQGHSVGLVPTMGALHKGHLALINASKQENRLTICSIYVNPTQFNNPEDLAHYPRNFDLDAELLEKVGCDIIFYPSTEEMYPESSTIRFDFGVLDKVMEGEFRPGHFSGVALVVAKLLNICQPDRAYFGQKDWQQFAIVKQLAKELKFPVNLITIPTVREENGLAMSSRNQRLTEQEREDATVFYAALKGANKAILDGKNLQKVKRKVAELVNGKSNVRLEYFELADSVNLKLLDSVESEHLPVMCIAGYVGNVRLIDNMFIDLSFEKRLNEN